MDYIKLDKDNIADEHICCAISDKKCREGYLAKKEWIKSQFDDGFTFRKLDARGKVFIEYCDAEKAWAPIDAPGYTFISCFWVSGKFKGQGHGKDLLQSCIDDSKDKNGIIAISSKKKQPFLNDSKFLKLQGFELVDSSDPYFELYCLKLSKEAPDPKIKECAKHGICNINDGIAVYYSNGCPFTEYYVEELGRVSKEKAYKFSAIKLDTREKAQNHFVPFTIYSVFLNGKFVTQHILNEKYFDKFIKK